MSPYRSFMACAVVGASFGLAAFFHPGSLRCSLAAPVPVPAKLPEPQDPKRQRGDLIYSAGYSRDGKLLALAQAKSHDGTGEDKVLLFDTRTWKQLHALAGPTARCYGVAFSADGNRLFAACIDGIVYSWDTKTGTPGHNLDAKDGVCGGMTLSPDGKILATGHGLSDQNPKRTAIHLWDVATGKPLRSIVSDTALRWTSPTVTPDGKAIAAGYSPLTGPKDFSGVIEWDIATGKERKRYDAVRITDGASPIACSVEYTRDGKWMLVGGGEAVRDPRRGGLSTYAYLWVFNRETGKLEKTLVDRRPDYVRRLLVSPDGDRLFVATYSAERLVLENGELHEHSTGELQCWDTRTWELKWAMETEPTHTGLPLIASPDGKRIGISTVSGFHLLDARTGELKGGLIDATKK
jgi:WD40 repeat protein